MLSSQEGRFSLQNRRVKLKKIALSGFKSFADKTTVSFGEGINAVVGPNGCGKSNIADAFRWVLGEQSAKSLRGGKMEDVLFAGTEKRKPMNMGEVTLTFDNSEKTISLPYTEFEITRRYYRGGEGEYLISGNPVRLRDVQTLMMELDLGKNPYVIFEQGKIDQIVLMSKEERRGLFEEASGIVCFLVSKKEALKKLEEAKIHIERVLDLQKLAGRQIALLEKEAQEARAYLQLKQEIADLEKRLFLWKIQKRDNERQLSLQESEKIVSLKSQTETLGKEARISKNALEKSLAEKRGQFELSFVAFTSLDKELSLVEAEQKNLKDGNGRSLKEKELHSHFLAERAKTKASDENRKRESLTLLDQQKKELSSQLRELEEIIPLKKKSEEGVSFARRRLDDAQARALVILRKKGAEEGTKKRYETVLEMTESRLGRLSENEVRLSDQIVKKEEERALLAKMEKELLEEKQTSDTRILGLREKIKTLFTEEKTITEEGERHQLALSKSSAKLQVLLKMQEEQEGISTGAKRIKKEFPDIRSLFEVIPPLKDSLKAMLLRPYEATLVTATREERKRILVWAKKERIFGFSILCREEISGPLEESLLSSLSLLHLDEEGELQEISLSQAQLHMGLLQREQSILSSLGAEKEGWFEWMRNLALLEKEVLEAKQAYEGHLVKKRRFLEEKNALYLQQEEGERLQRQTEKKLLEHHFSSEKKISETKMAQKELLSLQKEKEALEQERANAAIELQKISTLQKEASSLEEIPEREIDHLKKSLEERLRETGSMKRQFEEGERKRLSLEKEVARIEHLLEIHLVQEREVVKKEVEAENRLQILEQELLQEAAKISELANLQQDKRKALSLAEESYLCHKEAVGTIEKEFTLSSREVERIAEKEKKVDEQLHQQALLQKAIDTEISTMQAEFFERFQEELSLASIPTSAANIEGEERRLLEKRHQISRLSQVNFAAEETLAKEMTVASDLSLKISDLRKSETLLLSHLEELEEKSRSLFKETFYKIQASFKKNFSVLFEGGEADLVMEGDELLSSKIDIVARPPGKKLQSITLLSGGERCLTAMALLFSIFEVKVSPFCILDEIDAPLDEANVDRFANLLAIFAEKTQFILITHNKKTMAIADRLLGVTMQEKGVSKMILMEFMNKEVAVLCE